LGDPPLSVAVVEDDPSMRKSIERLLNAHGYHTVAYDSAEAFLAGQPLTPIDCLVLDIQLQGMSGLQLQHQLFKSGSNLPIVFITAVDDAALEAQATEAGCVAYLHKPFPAEHLLSAIEQV